MAVNATPHDNFVAGSASSRRWQNELVLNWNMRGTRAYTCNLCKPLVSLASFDSQFWISGYPHCRDHTHHYVLYVRTQSMYVSSVQYRKSHYTLDFRFTHCFDQLSENYTVNLMWQVKLICDYIWGKKGELPTNQRAGAYGSNLRSKGPKIYDQHRASTQQFASVLSSYRTTRDDPATLLYGNLFSICWCYMGSY